MGILSHNISVPQKVKGFTSFNITKMCCTGKIFKIVMCLDEASAALTNSGDLFVWGRNLDNVMGLGCQRKTIIEPTRVNLFVYQLVPH